MRKFLLILSVAAAAALAVASGAGILASPNSPASPWTSYYQLTLQVGSSYEINLKPDSAMCNRADARRDGHVAADATFASSSGGSIAQQSATGFQDQRGGNPWRKMHGTFGPLNGLSLHQRADGLWLVGEPHEATTSTIPIYYSRTCQYSAGLSRLGTWIYLRITGVGTHPDVSAASRAHQHHHPEYALASDVLTQNAADTLLVPRAEFDALAKRLAMVQCRANPTAIWSDTETTTRTFTTPSWRDIEPRFRPHCCAVPWRSTDAFTHCARTSPGPALGGSE